MLRSIFLAILIGVSFQQGQWGKSCARCWSFPSLQNPSCIYCYKGFRESENSPKCVNDPESHCNIGKYENGIEKCLMCLEGYSLNQDNWTCATPVFDSCIKHQTTRSRGVVCVQCNNRLKVHPMSLKNCVSPPKQLKDVYEHCTGGDAMNFRVCEFVFTLKYSLIFNTCAKTIGTDDEGFTHFLGSPDWL